MKAVVDRRTVWEASRAGMLGPDASREDLRREVRTPLPYEEKR